MQYDCMGFFYNEVYTYFSSHFFTWLILLQLVAASTRLVAFTL
jgi:hypothetical protein